MLSVKKTGLKREEGDKYYTKDAVVKLCVEAIKKHVKFDTEDIIIEPSAGNGSFIEAIKQLSNNYKFYDLEPRHNEVIKLDYLGFNPNTIIDYSKAHIIGNPPFGRQSSLAIKFIKKSCEYASSISFILPKSFKKDSMKRSFSKYFHLILELDLPKKSFIIDNVEHDVPCVFQIWKKMATERIVPDKLEPLGYYFVKKDADPDISFRRVGVYAGKISREIEDKSQQSHYFIKFNKKMTDGVFNKLCECSFGSKDNTVGPRSISKQELIKEYNEKHY